VACRYAVWGYSTIRKARATSSRQYGAASTPSTVPGAQSAATLSLDDAGSPRTRRYKDKIPGLSYQNWKELRKLSKVHNMPTEDCKTKQ
jgi:hypothetical protein